MHAQLGSMFDDCLSDLMEELWAALQYGGSAHSKVEILANRMTHREAEIEEQAQKRCVLGFCVWDHSANVASSVCLVKVHDVMMGKGQKVSAGVMCACWRWVLQGAPHDPLWECVHSCRVIKLSQELAEVQEELTGCKEALRAETAQTKKLLIANDAKEAQLSAAINGYEVCVCV